MSGSGIGVVLTTVGSEEQAETLARALVEGKLAACVNVVAGIRSIYRWQGRVEDEREHLVLAKIRAEAFGAVRAAIRRIHPYDTPEVVLLDVRDGDPDYLAWVLEATDSAEPT